MKISWTVADFYYGGVALNSEPDFSKLTVKFGTLWWILSQIPWKWLVYFSRDLIEQTNKSTSRVIITSPGGVIYKKKQTSLGIK